MDFNFITESPKKNEEQLEFGHKEIVATIHDIVVTQKQNLTIGLFGSWGTGKSSIVESLKVGLLGKQIPLIVFDVWKHEGDALRRTFITECREQLFNAPYGEGYIDQAHSLSENLVGSKTTTNEKLIFRGKELMVNILIAAFGILLMFVAATLICLFLWAVEVDVRKYIGFGKIMGVLTAGVTASLFFKYANQFVRLEKKEIKKEKFQDPHEFQYEFKSLVGALKNESRKVVITFDNLDRISGNSALDIISTIKTFLDFKSTENDHTVFFSHPLRCRKYKEPSGCKSFHQRG